MKNKLLVALLVVVLILSLGVAAAMGYLWYQENHIFVEGKAYPINAESLDLREEDISIAHYDSLHAQLPNCQVLWMVPFQGGKVSNDTVTLPLDRLSHEDMALLPYFPSLKTIQAGFDDYAILEELKGLRPDLEVVYKVSLGGKTYAPDVTELTLETGDYTLETLTENLKHLPGVTAVTLKKPDITIEQLEELRSAYEGIEFHCTVEILGQEYDTETREIDLSMMASSDVEQVSGKLAMLPGLTRVDLVNADGVSQLAKEDVKALQIAAPHAVFHYTFDFFGKTLSTADEEVEIKNTRIGDDNEDELRLALDLLPNCKRFVLDNCHFSDEVLAQVREDYREQTKVVWRVWFGKGSSLTDVDILRAVYDLVDSNCRDLIYCEDVRFIDFGHNEYLNTCEFVAGMPNLEYIILSGSPIKDLTPFENCKKLKMLEVAFCEYLTDATPLAKCESLEMLNISNTHILDLSPLDNLPLTHLCARLNPSGKSRISAEEQARFMEQHPDCWSTFDGAQPYGVGWRYDEDEITKLSAYALIADVMRYDIYPRTPNHVGWYLENEEKE